MNPRQGRGRKRHGFNDKRRKAPLVHAENVDATCETGFNEHLLATMHPNKQHLLAARF